jgi:hypothetical protein
MDPKRFDTLTKTFLTAGTRRGALGGLLAGTLSLLGLVDVTAKKRRHATAEGPCGNGRAKANKCKKDKDRCTRYCHKKKGRCRCKQLGQECTEDRNCCASAGEPMTCQRGSCQTVPPGCTPTTCAARGKTCGTISNGCGGTLNCGSNGACCGTPNGGTRCQGGACVAATATVADCQGAAAWEITPQSPSAGSRPPARPAPPLAVRVSLASAPGRTALGSIAPRE